MSIHNQTIRFLGSGTITAGSGALQFLDTNLTTYLPLTESGESALDGSFTAISILGALNELVNQVGGGSGTPPVDFRSVSGSIIPDTDNVYDIGSSSLRFREVVSASGEFGSANVQLGQFINLTPPANMATASLLIDHSSSNHAAIQADAANGNGIEVNNDGNVGLIVNNLGSADRGTGVLIESQTNVGKGLVINAGVAHDAVEINHSGVGIAIDINSTNTGAAEGINITTAGTGNGLSVTKNTTVGINAVFTQNTATTNVSMVQTANQTNLALSKTATGAGDVLSISNNGFGSALSVDSNAAGNALYINQDGASNVAYFIQNQAGQINHLVDAASSSFGSIITLQRCARAATSLFFFQSCQSDFLGTTDTEIILRGDGVILSDGGTTTPADYAEFFETLNPSGLPFGIMVQLGTGSDGDKVVPADDAKQVLGVTSPAPAVTADAHWDRWKDKYLKDDFGGYVLDPSGHKVINPSWDPDEVYVPRSERPEWMPIGMLGKLWVRCSTFNTNVGNWVTVDPERPGGVIRATSEHFGSGIPAWKVIEAKSWRDQKQFRPVRIVFR